MSRGCRLGIPAPGGSPQAHDSAHQSTPVPPTPTTHRVFLAASLLPRTVMLSESDGSLADEWG